MFQIAKIGEEPNIAVSLIIVIDIANHGEVGGIGNP